MSAVPYEVAGIGRAREGEPTTADNAAAWAMRIVDVEGPEWRALLEHSDHTLFHEPQWARVTQRGFGGEVCAVVFEKDGSPCGGALGFSFRSLWARFLYFNVPYGGVVGQMPDRETLGRLLREVGRVVGVARVRFTDSPMMSPAGLADFDRVDQSTQLLDLGDGGYEALWTGFKARIRRDVRKAERSGVTVVEATSKTEVAEFYNLYLDSMKRNGAVAKYSKVFVDAIDDELGHLGRGVILLARREGVAIAGVVIVDSATMSHYLMGGSTTAGLSYCPNDLLLHTAIRRAVEKGRSSFDFLPSGVGDEALERFKAKWGAVAHPISSYTAVMQPMRMAIWDTAYRVAENPLSSAVLRAVRRMGR